MTDRPSSGFREADHYGRTIQRLQAEVTALRAERAALLDAFAAVIAGLEHTAVSELSEVRYAIQMLPESCMPTAPAQEAAREHD